MPKKKKTKKRKTLKGTPEQHIAAGKKSAEDVYELADKATKAAQSGNCSLAISNLRQMAKAEGATLVHYEGARQSLPAGVTTFASSATRIVVDKCKVR